jgi:hypothetical protein
MTIASGAGAEVLRGHAVVITGAAPAVERKLLAWLE